MKKYINIFLVIVLCGMIFLNKKFFLLILWLEKWNIKNYSAFVIVAVILLSAYCLIFYIISCNNKTNANSRKLLIGICVLLAAIGIYRCSISAFYKCSPTITIYADTENKSMCITVPRDTLPKHITGIGIKGQYLEIQCDDKNNDWNADVQNYFKTYNLDKVFIEKRRLRGYSYVIG